MANKADRVPESFEFHPCDTPRGMEYYNLELLTKEQQRRLNLHKTEIIRENHRYLFKNPEIRAVLNIIVRKIFTERPSHDIERFVGRFFQEDWESITEEVAEYVNALPGKPEATASKMTFRDDRHVTVLDSSFEETSLSLTSSEEIIPMTLIKEILEELLDKVAEAQYHKKVRTSESVEIIDDKKLSDQKSYEDDDEIYFDLGLDFELDFSGYHEDDKDLVRSFATT